MACRGRAFPRRATQNGGVEAPRPPALPPGPRGRGAVGPVHLPPRAAGSQETSTAKQRWPRPAGSSGDAADPLPSARAPSGAQDPARGMSLRHPANFGPPWSPPVTPRPINPGPPTATCRPLPSQPRSTLRAVSRLRAGTSVCCRPATAQVVPPRKARGLTVPGAGAARRPGRVAAAHRAGAARAAHREAPRRRGGLGSGRRRPDGPAQPLQWRCRRGARVTAGGRPKPRRFSALPAAARGPSPHFAAPPRLLSPLWVLSGAGLRSVKIGRPRGRKITRLRRRVPCARVRRSRARGFLGTVGGDRSPALQSESSRTCVFNR